jgi:hypothetical protein
LVSYLRSNGSRDTNFRSGTLPSGLALGPFGIAYDAKIQDEVVGGPGYAKIVAGGGGVPGDTSSDFVLARFETSQSLGGAVGGALDSGFGKNGVATTDFAKNQAYSSGYDVARGIDLAGGDPDHAYSIVAAGFSGTAAGGGNLALAEYLPRNRILVVSSFGGFASSGDTSVATGTSSLEEEDEESTSASDLLATS